MGSDAFLHERFNVMKTLWLIGSEKIRGRGAALPVPAG
jgi:hypothetical protein